MGILRTKTIEPATGSTLTLGASGDTITVSSDSIKTNTFKDAGGNTLFTSDGAGTLSSINSGLASGTDFVLISTSTASDAASIAITSGIDSTYDEYMFVLTDMGPATDGEEPTFQGSIDSGSNYNVAMTTTQFRANHYEDGASATLSYSASSDQAQGTAYQILSLDMANHADASWVGILHLFNPSNTTYVKHFYATVQGMRRDSSTVHNFVAGYFNTTSAIDAISFKMSSGNLDGVIQMYGIK